MWGRIILASHENSAKEEECGLHDYLYHFVAYFILIVKIHDNCLARNFIFFHSYHKNNLKSIIYNRETKVVKIEIPKKQANIWLFIVFQQL